MFSVWSRSNLQVLLQPGSGPGPGPGSARLVLLRAQALVADVVGQLLQLQPELLLLQLLFIPLRKTRRRQTLGGSDVLQNQNRTQNPDSGFN